MSNDGNQQDAMAEARKQQEEQMNQQIRVTALNLAVHQGTGSSDEVLSDAKVFEEFIRKG